MLKMPILLRNLRCSRTETILMMTDLVLIPLHLLMASQRNNLAKVSAPLMVNLDTPIVRMSQLEALMAAQHIHMEPPQKARHEPFQMYLRKALRQIQISIGMVLLLLAVLFSTASSKS